MRRINPAGIAGPFATYAHGVEVESNARILFGAGQTGVAADGTVPDSIEGSGAARVVEHESDSGRGEHGHR